MKKQGFTLVEIMIVVAIIGLLAAIAIPSFMKARTQSQLNACMNNLRQIAAAKEQWGLENKKVAADAPSDLAALVGTTLWIKDTPVCPATGTYSIGALSDECSCDIHGTVAAPTAQ
jgi:type IV pilus assembly protein PilA